VSVVAVDAKSHHSYAVPAGAVMVLIWMKLVPLEMMPMMLMGIEIVID
jgi:hypothetical protein